MMVFGGCGFDHSRGTASSDTNSAGAENDTDVVRYRELPVHYKIASTIPAEFHADIRAGFSSWNEATGVEIFVYDGIKSLQDDQLAPDFTVNENVVLQTNRSGQLAADAAQGSDGGPGPLARTYLKGATKIMDADVYLFEFDTYFVNGRPDTGDIYSLESVVAHEAGHILFGSDHSSDEESIMTAVLYPKDNPKEKLGPSQSDADRFEAVYADLIE